VIKHILVEIIYNNPSGVGLKRKVTIKIYPDLGSSIWGRLSCSAHHSNTLSRTIVYFYQYIICTMIIYINIWLEICSEDLWSPAATCSVFLIPVQRSRDVCA